MGDNLDLKGGKALGVGCFAMMPTNMNPFEPAGSAGFLAR
jgi:hypothetical protein